MSGVLDVPELEPVELLEPVLLLLGVDISVLLLPVVSVLLLCFLCFFLPLLVSVELVLWSVLVPAPLIEVLELLLPVWGSVLLGPLSVPDCVDDCELCVDGLELCAAAIPIVNSAADAIARSFLDMNLS